MLTAGTRIGPYEILSSLGAGGMGEVFRARDARLQRDVAVKLLGASSQDPAAVQRFLQEARAAAALSHPNILAIYDVGEHEGRPYLVTELLEGETLRDRIGRCPLSLREAVEVALQASKGLAAAHQRGLVHRDVKPENLFLTRDGGVKILDFGLAKPAPPAEEKDGGSLPTAPLLTESGIVLGTIGYISPEQLRGKPADPRSDLFALGCVLYEMISGSAAFLQPTGAETVAAILKEEPAPLDSGGVAVPQEIDALVRRCLEKEPARRPSTAGEVVKELEEVLGSQAVSSHRSAAVDLSSSEGEGLPLMTAIRATRAFSLVRRRPVWVALAGVAAIAAAAAVWWLADRTRQEPRPPAGADYQKTIVVLPFENLGPAEERYFADGVTKEITARLSEVAGLGVIDPSSALSYRGEGKPLARVAEELRAQYVLQGSVRWQRGPEGMGRVRVTPQLIRAGDERQLWAHVYEREMKDLFDVQSDIARSVVAALNLALGPSGLMGLDSHPTTDMEAYDHYLRGMAFFTGSTSEEDSRLALQMFEKAVALDPRFALAWAVSARAHMRMYNSYFDRSEARLHLADEASRRALAIAPDLPEALIARGLYYYWGFKDYARGIEQFDKVLAKRPDHPGALELKAYVFRRQGRFEEALALLERVFPLNPRAGILAKEMGTTAMLLRRYSEAHRFYDEALTLAPDMAETYCLKAQLTLSETGERAKALAVLESALEMGIQDGDVIAYSAILMAMDGRTGEALERLDRSAVKAFSAMDNYEPRELVRGRILELAGRKAEARAEYGKAARVLRDLIRSDPGDARFQSALGLALAGLGSWPEAFAAGRRGVELMPVAKDALEAPPRVLDLARLHALKGQPREAWKLLEPLLASPTLVSAGYLRSDPVWRDVVEIGAPAPEDES